MRITVLVENSVGKPVGLIGEHGLSLWVEHEGHKILFDTGQRGAVVPNAHFLGIDLREAEAIVLSHGHYDHTGGLRAVLEYIGRRIPVYAHPDVFSLHRISSPFDRYLGIPYCREELDSLGAEFRWVKEPLELFPGLWLSGEVPRRTKFEQGDKRMYVLVEGKKVPDPLADDLSLYLKISSGLVILLGCAHAGVINIVQHAQEVTGEKRVAAIIGGTHLGSVSEEQMEETIVRLTQMDLDLLATNHCTGLDVAARLREIFGARFSFANTGKVLEL